MCVVAFLLGVRSLAAHATDPFANPLARGKQALHVLNRVAYGPRPGQIEEVKRFGVDLWIRAQLYPKRLPESPVAQRKLQALITLEMPTWLAFEKHLPRPEVHTPLARLLSAEDVATLQSGAVEERSAILKALTGEKRTRVLLVLPPAGMAGLPDVQTEAFNLRQAEAERQRQLRPTLADILAPPNITTLFNGSEAEKNVLLRGLEPEQRRHVFRQVAPQAIPANFLREALAFNETGQTPLVELIDAKIYRAVYSTHQLEEVLVDFWLNHFNVFAGKGPVRMLLPSYERDAIRPHVLGRFRDMLLATAGHPAMLFYLDNWQSQGVPDRVLTAGDAPLRPTGLNENYGRELLELHTLGVDGGYTQVDVIDVARAFTGWTIHEPNRYCEFHFNPSMHDREEKVVLGHTLARGGGADDGVRVIDILARHPSTARFIARKLVQRFVADDAPNSLVDRVAEVFIKTDGDLRAVTESVLRSREFLSEGAWRSKVKSPAEFAFSALRAADADVSDPLMLAQRIGEMGQPLYGKSEPTGYSNSSTGWGSAGNLIARINFAAAMASGQIAGAVVEPYRLPMHPRALATRLLGFAPSSQTLNALNGGPPPDAGRLLAVVLGSPDFQKR